MPTVTSRLLPAAALGAAALAWTPPVRADVSSWAYVGGGGATYADARTDRVVRSTLSMEAGLGSTPSAPIAVGALFHVQPYFGSGTDLGLLARIATYGYTNGAWGAALDLGGYQRFWGIGSTGGMGTLSLGAPWGITLNISALRGTGDSSSYFATLGIDFARLTVYRTTGTSWFHNPFPAVREERRRY